MDELSAIRPAMDTLRELRHGQTLDEFAVQIHDAVSAVEALGKPATVTLTITVKPFGTKGVAGAYAVLGEITSKMPKPDPEVTLLFTDADGNLTPHQTRQRDLGLSIASNANNEERVA